MFTDTRLCNVRLDQNRAMSDQNSTFGSNWSMPCPWGPHLSFARWLPSLSNKAPSFYLVDFRNLKQNDLCFVAPTFRHYLRLLWFTLWSVINWWIGGLNNGRVRTRGRLASFSYWSLRNVYYACMVSPCSLVLITLEYVYFAVNNNKWIIHYKYL